MAINQKILSLVPCDTDEQKTVENGVSFLGSSREDTKIPPK
jgi:hypothetical protein